MNHWQAIIFDLDDTLYAECDYVFSGFKSVATWAETQLQIPAAQAYAELQSLFGQGVRGDTFNCWLASHDLAAAIVPQLVSVYRNHEPVLMPFPEVPTLLDTMHRRYRLGLVSDGYLDVQQRKLTALGLAPHFDAVVFSDELGRECWKPSPRPFELVLERLGADASRAVYVADNPLKDFRGARQAGMTAIWVRRPAGEYARHEPKSLDYAPHQTIINLEELEQTLHSLADNFLQ